MSLSAGSQIGPYKVVSLLGAGGMGEVWRAQDERLKREVALKVLPPDVSSDPTRRARFEQEARSLGALNHPNIVAVYDVGEEAGLAYMVSELIDGESLRDVILRGPVAVRKAIDYAVQLAEGLAAAHDLGIIHRDLKPENVMVTRTGRVKVLDFGLAKQSAAPAADAATMAMSQPGMVMGTAGYMSPEQVRGEAVDARSDIFSFGCVLYELVSGQRAFQAGTSVETMSAILNQEPAGLESTDAALPPGLATMIRRCLEKRPEQRFQSAADLAFALRAMTTVTASGLAVPAAPRIAKPSRNWIRVAAFCLAAVALFAAGVLARMWMTKPAAAATYQRVTFRKGFINNALFSADGRSIIYAANWEGGPSRIYLAIPGSPDSRDLGLPDGSSLLAVSSQQEIAYADQKGNLMRGSISGGKMRPLLDDVLAADFSPDGSSMAVLREIGNQHRLEYPLGTVVMEDVPFPLAMRLSPDGALIAFTSFVQGRRVGLSIVDRKGKRTILGVISGQTSSNLSQALCWTRKGDEIWFRSYDSSDSQTIYAMDLKGRRRIVGNLPAGVSLYDISRDGKALISTGSTRWGISGAGPGDKEERDLSCLDQGVLMGISNDGKMIVASVSGDSGGAKGSVYVRSTDGSPPVRLDDGLPYDISPDGKWVSGYVPADGGGRRFVLFPTGPGSQIEVKPPGLPSAAVFGWLGDQQYLVAGRLQGKKYQCFAWDAKAGTLRAVCPEGTPDRIEINSSPDGRWVMNSGPKGGWFVYPVDGGAPQEIHGIGPEEEPFGWRDDSRSVYVKPHRAGNRSTPVWIVEIATGKRSPWKEIRPSQPVDFPYDLHLHITPDGNAYAYNVSISLSDLYVAQGLK